MPELKIGVSSDDLVNYDYEGESEEIGTGEMRFSVTLPDGTKMPIKVDYGSWGWEFTLDLPDDTIVEPIHPEEE